MIGQLLGAYWLMGCDCLMVEVNEVLDAQTVDVRIVSDSLQGKVLAVERFRNLQTAPFCTLERFRNLQTAPVYTLERFQCSHPAEAYT